jgi:hypothetical protein
VDLELKRKVVNVKLDGQSYALTVPNLKEVEKYSSEAKDVSDPHKNLSILCSFLEKRGLPKAVVESLEVEHLNLLIDNLMGLKKS